MAADAHNAPPDASALRSFGLQMAMLIAGAFGLLLPWAMGLAYPAWPWFIAAAFAVPALAAPRRLAPVYRAWMTFARALNRITSPLVLGLLFFVAIVPAALIMKLAGRDTMRRRRESGAESYRIESERTPAADMEKPY